MPSSQSFPVKAAPALWSPGLLPHEHTVVVSVPGRGGGPSYWKLVIAGEGAAGGAGSPPLCYWLDRAVLPWDDAQCLWPSASAGGLCFALVPL